MKKLLLREILSATRAVAVVLVLGCVLYPLAVFAIGHALFPFQAEGSLIGPTNARVSPEHAIGSRILGQAFKAPQYFHPRPSAAGSGYDAANSGGTNLGPISDKLLNGAVDDPKTKDVDESFDGIKQLVRSYRAENGLADGALVPADAVTRSGSGLDPDISPENAALQVARVAAARAVNPERVRAVVQQESRERQFGIFGEPRVNVLALNLALDRELPPAAPSRP